MSIQSERPPKSFSSQRETSRNAASTGEAPKLPVKQQTATGVKGLILIALALLVVLLGGDVRQTVEGKAISPAVAPVVSGPFIQFPLGQDQINQVHHLSANMNVKALAQMYLSHMTLDQKLGQLFMVQYWGYAYSQDLETMVHNQYAGGVIMYGAQMQTFDQTKADIERMQKKAWMPLLVSSDEEGGFVQRIMNIYGNRPGALQTYETGNIANAAKLGQGIAHDLLTLGINTDLAPDVDVPLVQGPDQYMRTWGYTPQSVITWGGTYLRAVQGDGVIACLKHFPGLGAASTDAHTGLPVVKRTRDQLYATELAPYSYFVHSQNRLDNPGMIMTTDVLMPAIDPTMPAELSHTFVTGILRDQLGYNGVVLTDALYMLGIAKKWSVPQAVVLAIQAGNDMILGVRDSSVLSASVAAIKQALADGSLTMQRINESVKRIIALKIQYHLWATSPIQ